MPASFYKPGRDVRLVADAPPSASSEALWEFVDGHEATEWTRQRTVATQGGMDVVRWELAEAVPKLPGEDTFFDLAAVHLITTSTLERFAELSPGVTFDPRRFRPNILLETREEGFVEQDWIGSTLWCGEASMFAMVPTPRCAMPTLPQQYEDLPNDRRILQSVTRHNSLELELLGPGKWACAGVYANPLSSGMIALGDAMELRETTPEVIAAMTEQG